MYPSHDLFLLRVDSLDYSIGNNTIYTRPCILCLLMREGYGTYFGSYSQHNTHHSNTYRLQVCHILAQVFLTLRREGFEFTGPVISCLGLLQGQFRSVAQWILSQAGRLHKVTTVCFFNCGLQFVLVFFNTCQSGCLLSLVYIMRV